MTNTDVRRRTAEIAFHLAAIRALARDIRCDHPQGEALYRALQHGGLPAEHADPVGAVEDVLQHPMHHVSQEGTHEHFR